MSTYVVSWRPDAASNGFNRTSVSFSGHTVHMLEETVVIERHDFIARCRVCGIESQPFETREQAFAWRCVDPEFESEVQP